MKALIIIANNYTQTVFHREMELGTRPWPSDFTTAATVFLIYYIVIRFVISNLFCTVSGSI